MANDPSMAESTTIKLLKTTKERLDKYGKFGDTYDDILVRILDKIKDKEN